MSFNVKTTRLFLEQVHALSKDARMLVGSKIDLIAKNPFRFKRIHSKKFSHVFRVRLNLDGKETRLIYLLMEPDVVIACLLERKNDYKDLEKMLEKSLRG